MFVYNLSQLYLLTIMIYIIAIFTVLHPLNQTLYKIVKEYNHRSKITIIDLSKCIKIQTNCRTRNVLYTC